MKVLVALLLAAAGTAFAQGDIEIGHVRHDGSNIEIYNVQAACHKNAGLSASRSPSLTPNKPYDMGCWKPLNEEKILVVFEDGTMSIVDRKDLVPAGQEKPRVSL